MEHPSPYHTSNQVPYLDVVNPASHLGTYSTPHRQRDRYSSVASGLNDFQTLHNIDMNNFLSPGPNSFHNTPAQLDDYVMGTEKKWSQEPMDLNFSHTSTTRSLFRYLNVPLDAESSVMNPLHNILTNDQGLDLMEQLEAWASGYHPNGLQPQGIAHGRNFPTDAPPCNQVTHQGPGNAQHIDSRARQYSGDNVRPTAPPRQAYSTTFDFNYAAPPQMFDPYVSDPVAISPEIKSEYCEPSEISTDPGFFTTCCPTGNVTRDIKLESLDTFTPLHRSRNVSESNDYESPTVTPVPRLQRRRRRPIPAATRSEALDFSNTAASPPPPPPPIVTGVVDSSMTLTPGRSIEYDLNLTYPEPSNNIVENKDDPDAFLRYITTFYDDPNPLGSERRMADLGAPDVPIVKKEHVRDAPKPSAAQHSPGQSVGDAGSEQKAVHKAKKRKRTRSDAISTETKQHQQAKKPRRKTNPNSTRGNLSHDHRRRHPTWLFFCVDQECYASTNPIHSFRGFVTKEDAQRHLLTHGPPRFFCPYSHKTGKGFEAKRADNFKL